MHARFVCLVIAILSVGRAAPPAGIDGLIYYERIGVGAFNDTYYQLIEFRDGGFEVVAQSSSHRPLLRPSTPGRGARGTYRYTVTGSDTATLTLTSDAGGGGRVPGIDRVTLKFQTDRAGALTGTPGGGGSFTFGPAMADAALLNQSSRGFIAADRPLRAGFVLARRAFVMIRAVGPGLRQFGINAAAGNPALQVEGNRIEAANDDWSNDLVDVTRFARYTGAFPLEESSKDAVLVLLLNPGAYVATASVSGADNGEMLLETYLVLSEN